MPQTCARNIQNKDGRAQKQATGCVHLVDVSAVRPSPDGTLRDKSELNRSAENRPQIELPVAILQSLPQGQHLSVETLLVRPVSRPSNHEQLLLLPHKVAKFLLMLIVILVVVVALIVILIKFRNKRLNVTWNPVLAYSTGNTAATLFRFIINKNNTKLLLLITVMTEQPRNWKR